MRAIKYIAFGIVGWLSCTGAGTLLAINWYKIEPIKEDVMELITGPLILGTIVAMGVFFIRLVLRGPLFRDYDNGEYHTPDIDRSEPWFEQVYQLSIIGEQRRATHKGDQEISVNIPDYWEKYRDPDLQDHVRWIERNGKKVNIRVNVVPEDQCVLGRPDYRR